MLTAHNGLEQEGKKKSTKNCKRSTPAEMLLKHVAYFFSEDI